MNNLTSHANTVPLQAARAVALTLGCISILFLILFRCDFK